MAVDSVFVSELLVNFRTGHVPDGARFPIYDARLVARTYARGWLVADLLATMPVIVEPIVEACAGEGVGSSTLRSLQLVRTLRLAKLLRLIKLNKVVKRHADNLALRVNQLIFSMVFVGFFASICMRFLPSASFSSSSAGPVASSLSGLLSTALIVRRGFSSSSSRPRPGRVSAAGRDSSFVSTAVLVTPLTL